MMRSTMKHNQKLYPVIAIFILLGLSLGIVNYFGNKLQDGNRGYISGESEWAKAQKEATIYLMRYVYSGDDQNYNRFKDAFEVIEGDRVGRQALMLDSPDLETARQGFLQGNKHPDDVDEMIWLFLNFGWMDPIEEALGLWENGETLMDEKVQLGEEVRASLQDGPLSGSEIDAYYSAISEIDQRLSLTEQNFSAAMTRAGRQTGTFIFWVNILLSTVFIFIAAYFAVSHMKSLRRANEKLVQSDHKFRNVLDHSRDVIYQINIGSEKYDYMSSSVKDMLGLDPKEVMEGGPQLILERTHPEDLERMRKRNEQNRSDQVEETMVEDSEFRVKRADDTYIWVNNKRALVRDEDGTPVAIVGNVRDISVRKRQMEKLDQSLNEKQTLLAEIHHRVKNNLAIVSSLIELQKDEVPSELKPSFRNVQSRIKSIALIHEKLYETTIFSEVELADYLDELSEMISHTYRSRQNRVDIHLDLEDVKVDMTTAVPVGLICNELINNSFKHAFNHTHKGNITVSLREIDNHVEVEVTDDGDGLPDDFSMDNAQSLGVTLLQVLTQQINGHLSVESSPDTRFRLTFPKSAGDDNQKQKETKKTGS